MDGLKTKEDRRFQTFWVIFFILISVIAIIPVLRVISISFSGRDAINKGQVFIFPIGFNVDAYAKALKSGTFVSSFGYSIILMAVVTAVDMIMTILLAYPLSRKGLKGSKIVNLFCVITMYLNLGTIPNYLNIKSFGMIDTVWALIIPGALSVYNMIIMRTAFASIDDSLYEAARIDGASRLRQIWSITLPLMKTIICLNFILTVSGLLRSNLDQTLVLMNTQNRVKAEVIDSYVYRMGIAQGDFSYATAVGLGVSIVSVILLLIANYFTSKVNEESVL